VTNAYGVGRCEGVVKGNYKYEPTKVTPEGAKICRMTVDCDTKRSLFCGWLINMIKDSLSSVDMLVAGVRVRFIKTPDPVLLGQMYTDHYHSGGFVAFSDDGRLDLHCADGLLTTTVDIKSCDSVNGLSTARLLYAVTPPEYHELVDGIISHGQQVLTIGYGKNKIRARPLQFFEYSGALFTTAINTLAMYMSALHILEDYNPRCSKRDCMDMIDRKIATAPYPLEHEHVHSFWSGMFLKTYPARTHRGDIIAILATGVILRSSGRVNGDFQGTGEIGARVDAHMRCWVLGLQHAGNTAVLRAYQHKFPAQKGDVATHETGAIHRFQHGVNSKAEVDDLTVTECYGITMYHWMELVELIRECRPGESIACHASAVILRKDYGLTVPGYTS